MTPSPDRRVRRTKLLLHRALFELILEKGYTRTTVQDILDRADVGRSTFYSHYRAVAIPRALRGRWHLEALARTNPPAAAPSA